MEHIENRTFDDIAIGDSATLTRTLTEQDITLFAVMRHPRAEHGHAPGMPYQGGAMKSPIKTPEQLLEYRSLQQILADRPDAVYSVRPGDSVLAAVQQMTARNVGFLVVLDEGKLAGVLSERDCARKALQEGRPPGDIPVSDVMVRDVFTVTLAETLPRCMALMHDRNVRHLPVLEQGRVVGVLSMRDLLREIVAHHERVIRDLELERMTILGGGTTY